MDKSSQIRIVFVAKHEFAVVSQIREFWESCDGREKSTALAMPNEECRRGAHLPYLVHEPVEVNEPLKSLMHCQCATRVKFNFPATGHHSLLTGTRFTAWWQWHMCEQQLLWVEELGWNQAL